MQLSIKYKENNKIKREIVPIYKDGILYTIDNFLKYGIIKPKEIKVSDIKNLDIIYEKNEFPSQTSERIASIVSKVIKTIKNI
ncbi:MAG: hypothetical protein PHG49_03870 [Candidatus Pacebacteria bacterium]|nr:hypothetical protein [Candidatus Paceibacterota bacterium]